MDIIATIIITIIAIISYIGGFYGLISGNHDSVERK